MMIIALQILELTEIHTRVRYVFIDNTNNYLSLIKTINQHINWQTHDWGQAVGINTG